MSRHRFFQNNLPDFKEGIVSNLYPEKNIEAIKSITHLIEVKYRPTRKTGEDGLYLGSGGVAYMYYCLSKCSELDSQRHRYLTLATEYLKPALTIAQLSATKKKDVPSFILGNCGIYAVASVIFKELEDMNQYKQYKNLYYDAAKICLEPNFLSHGSDELFVGRAGYILGALWLAKESQSNIKLNILHELCKVMVESGRKYKHKNSTSSPLMYSYYNVEYLGAAHGLSSILLALIMVPGYLDKYSDDAKDIKNSIDYILSLQDSEGNFPCTVDEIGRPNDLVHWCHGAPGIIYLMAKAYIIWNELKYLTSCETMTDIIWKKGLLKKGPGICHGVAGNGYSFLLMYRLTGQEKYLHRAQCFAEFMRNDVFKKNARTPDYPYSLYEGVAGTACFLTDQIGRAHV